MIEIANPNCFAASVVEPVIGYLRSGRRMDRNHFWHRQGDAADDVPAAILIAASPFLLLLPRAGSVWPTVFPYGTCSAKGAVDTTR